MRFFSTLKLSSNLYGIISTVKKHTAKATRAGQNRVMHGNIKEAENYTLP